MTMKEALMMMGGMTDTDDLTAIAAHVLEGETFLSAGSDDPQTGAMPDCGASQYAASMGEEGDDYAFEGFPEGWYHDNTKARLYKGTVREYLGITAAKIAKGQTIAGVAGSYDSAGTVSASDMKAGVVAYSKGQKVTGNQTDHGTVSKTLNAGESYTVSEGFYSAGKVAAATLASQQNAVVSTFGITAAKIAKGQTIAGVAGSYDSAGTVSASDMKAGVVAYSKGQKVTGNQTDHGTVSKTLNAGESYTVSEGFYSAGKVAAATLASQQNAVVSTFGITAAKIAKGQTIAGVAGSWYGNKAMISAFAVRGFDGSSSDYQTYEEDSFTMPADGMVYYGGANAGYKHISKCQILKNGTVVNSRDTSASEWYSGWRGTMFNQSFSARKGDVIKVICEQSSGTHGMSCIQAVIVY